MSQTSCYRTLPPWRELEGGRHRKIKMENNLKTSPNPSDLIRPSDTFSKGEGKR